MNDRDATRLLLERLGHRPGRLPARPLPSATPQESLAYLAIMLAMTGMRVGEIRRLRLSDSQRAPGHVPDA